MESMFTDEEFKEIEKIKLNCNDRQRAFIAAVFGMNVHKEELTNCHDCNAKPGEIHGDSCDVERCSVCGGQRLMDDCEGHDPAFARWTGFWPGTLEAKELELDLNEFQRQGYEQIFFVKPELLP